MKQGEGKERQKGGDKERQKGEGKVESKGEGKKKRAEKIQLKKYQCSVSSFGDYSAAGGAVAFVFFLFLFFFLVLAFVCLGRE